MFTLTTGNTLKTFTKACRKVSGILVMLGDTCPARWVSIYLCSLRAWKKITTKMYELPWTRQWNGCVFLCSRLCGMHGMTAPLVSYLVGRPNHLGHFLQSFSVLWYVIQSWVMTFSSLIMMKETSQSFPQGYGSILLISLTYIVQITWGMFLHRYITLKLIKK